MEEVLEDFFSIGKFKDNFFSDSLLAITEQKDRIISERLEKLGINFYVELENKRRFKRFVTEQKGNEETIYFNDGSFDGIRVVTFKIEHPVMVTNGRSTCCNVSYSYF